MTVRRAMTVKRALSAGILTIATSSAIAVAARPQPATPKAVLTTTGQGAVQTPTFHRYELGFASPRRLHEMSSDEEGNLWFSPLDGRLIRYATKTGEVEVLDLTAISGEEWRGRHLWPVPHGRDIYLQTPALDDLWVFNRDTRRLRKYPLPARNLRVSQGFAFDGHLYFGGSQGLVKWDPVRQTGTAIACPYQLSAPALELTFLEPGRREIWASTAFGNDMIRFDLRTDTWSGHWRAPEADSMPTAALGYVGETLFAKDHLKGRILPFTPATGQWGAPLPIPGFKERFGWVGGGTLSGGLFYFSHSTLVGTNGSIDGKPHHFTNSWSVFDPRTRGFSRLDVPATPGEDFIASKGIDVEGVLYITAVNAQPPHNAIVLRSRPLD